MSGSPAYDIAQRLDALGIGIFGATIGGWTIAVSREPVSPVSAITVYDTGGGPVDTDDQDMESPTIQVRTRSLDYLAGYAKQEEIRAALILAGFDVSGKRYYSAAATSGILAIGRDDADRFLLTQNFQLLSEAT